jgi:hypothetical protein
MPSCPACRASFSDSQMTYSDSGVLLCTSCALTRETDSMVRGSEALVRRNRPYRLVFGICLGLAVLFLFNFIGEKMRSWPLHNQNPSWPDDTEAFRSWRAEEDRSASKGVAPNPQDSHGERLAKGYFCKKALRCIERVCGRASADYIRLFDSEDDFHRRAPGAAIDFMTDGRQIDGPCMMTCLKVQDAFGNPATYIRECVEPAR